MVSTRSFKKSQKPTCKPREDQSSTNEQTRLQKAKKAYQEFLKKGKERGYSNEQCRKVYLEFVKRKREQIVSNLSSSVESMKITDEKPIDVNSGKPITITQILDKKTGEIRVLDKPIVIQAVQTKNGQQQFVQRQVL